MNNFNYRIGLDIGIASVGWSVLKHDSNDEPVSIVDLGVRVFNPAENPKDGSSLAVTRREARGNRRRLRRRAFRIDLARKFLIENLLDDKIIENNHNLDVYKLRFEGINRRITNEELYYLIIHFIKHRGFKSNRKSEKTNSENGKLLKSIEENKNYLLSKGYQTIGEMIYSDNKYFKINDNTGTKEYFVRNHNNYVNCFYRDDLEFELNFILEKQREFGNEKITQLFCENIISIFKKQRNFDDGPGDPSPFKSNFNVGNCFFEITEKRAPKGTFSFEYFNALQQINNLSYFGNDYKKHNITLEDKLKLIEILLQNSKLTYRQVRKTLNLSYNFKFTNLSYKIKNKDNNLTDEELIKKAESKCLCEFIKVKEYAKILNLNICKENKNIFNIIGYILSMRKSDDKRIDLFKNNGNDDLFETENVAKELIEALDNAKLTNDQIDQLIAINTDKFANLSLKALDKINCYLEEGFVYSDACEKAGYQFNSIDAIKRDKLLWNDITENGTNELQEITSPVVLRSVSQTFKVVNAIIDKYGSPSAIFIELARDMSLSHDERNKLKKKMDERFAENTKYIEQLKELGLISPSGQDIVKYRLYLEQDGKSMYSLKSFESVLGSVKEIFTNNNTQVDHIMPYSKCFDDSYNNKVLVLSNENQEKGNKVPREYITDENQWKNFENFVVNSKFSPKKKSRLLQLSSNIQDVSELNSRALNDTKQITKFMYNVLKNHLNFKTGKLIKKPVRCVNGNITAYLRKIWGINKIRFESDKHHALDACVIACASDSTIQKITQFEKYKSIKKAQQKRVLKKENDYYVDMLTGEIIKQDEYLTYFKNWEKEFDDLNGKINLVTAPWPEFVKELELRLSVNVDSEQNKNELQKIGYSYEELSSLKPVFVSRMPRRKMLGAIHKETIQSSKIYTSDNPKLIKRVPLEDLKFDLKTKEIINYAEFAKESDPVLYQALVNQMIKYNGNAKEAFKETFYKPIVKSDGTIVSGNPVKKVQVTETSSDFVCLNEGKSKVALKSSIVRIDVYKKDSKNYLVPIYISDVYKQVLPTIPVPYKNSKPMEERYFAFSIFPNDLIYLEKYKGDFKGKYVESQSKNSGKENITNKGLFYFIGLDVSTGSCNFINNDKSVEYRSCIKNVDVFEKYTVDILGNYNKVKNEKLRPLKFKRKK